MKGPVLAFCSLLSALMATSAAGAPPSVAAAVPASFSKTFTGTIGKHPITLTLTRRGQQLFGHYRYDQVRPRTLLLRPYAGLSFLGDLDAGGSFTSKEEAMTDEGDSSVSGKLAATLRLGPPPERSLLLEGTWSKPDGSRSLPLVAHERRLTATEARVATIERREGARAWRRIIKATFPEVREATGADQTFNTDVRRFVEDLVSQFKGTGPPGEDADRLYFALTFDVRHADDRIISVRFAIDSYDGGAHPSSNVFGYAFDRVAGKRMKLADLFLRGTPYRKILSTRAASVLASLDWSFPNWYMDQRGLWLVFFESHALGGYGEVFIPWGELRAVIDPAGPAGTLLAGATAGP
jgi:hypothetical protein